MRVLLVTTKSRGIGGVARTIEGLRKWLPRLGVEVEVLAGDRLPHIPLRALANPTTAVSSALYALIRAALKAFDFAQEYDVIHVHHLFVYPSAHILSRFLKAPLLLTMHGNFARQIAMLYGERLGRLALRLEAYALRAADIVTAVSPRVAKEYSERYSRRVFFVPNAIDDEELALRTRKTRVCEGLQVAFVGRLSPEKGFDLFLAAAATLSKVLHDVVFVAAGDGPLRHLALKWQEELNNFKYLGLLPHREALALIRGSDLLLLPSRAEGFPTVALEALALGTPVLASDIDEVRSSLRGLPLTYFKSGSLVSLVGKLLETLKRLDEVKRDAMRASRVVVQRYSWRTVAQRYIQLYKLVTR